MRNVSRRLFGLTLIEGVLFLFIVGIIAAILLPVYAGAGRSMRSPCLSNVKQLGLASIMYAADHDDHLPFALNWMDSDLPYAHSERVFHDTEGIAPGGYGYAFRKSASGVSTNAILTPGSFMMHFDSLNQERNASGNLELLPKPGRHDGRDSIVFADAHAKSIATDESLFVFLKNDKSAGPR